MNPPFYFWTQMHLIKLLGLKAKNPVGEERRKRRKEGDSLRKPFSIKQLQIKYFLLKAYLA